MQRPPLALALGLLAAGCVSSVTVAGDRSSERAGATARSFGLADSVLAVRWRRLLTEPGLIEYKPQEFAAAATDGTHVFIGSRGGNFFALRPSDGEVQWRKHIEGGVSSRPLYLADTKVVFVGGDDGAMYCLDAATGAERWVYRTKGPIGGEPVYDDGLLYFENGENRIYAIDAHSGAWRWQYDREAPETFTIRGSASPLLFGGRAYVGFSDGYLAALNARTGDVIWARSLAGESPRFNDVDATPVIVDGTLYVSSFSGGVYALDPGEGGVKWRYETEGASTVRVDRDRVFFASTRDGLHCLDTKGRLVWRQSLARQGELSQPVLVGDRYLLVSASEGGTYVVDQASGQLLQFFKPGHGVTAPPTSDGRQVYVLTNAGFFYAFSID
jgi:outer membrane protein assembly factor BamB